MLIKKLISIACLLLLSNFVAHVASAANEKTSPTTSTEIEVDQAEIYYKRAYDEYFLHNEIYSAIENLDKCIALNDHERDICLSLKAQIFCGSISVKKHLEGIRIYSQLIKKNEKADNKDIIVGFLYSSRGDCYSSANLNSEALSDYETACNRTDKEKYPTYWRSYCKTAFDFKHEMTRSKQWVYLGEAGQLAYYYENMHIIRLSNNDIKVWIRLEPIFDNNTDNFLYQLIIQHIDCTKREMALESEITYDSMSNIPSTKKYAPLMTNEAVVPGSIGEVLLDTICTKYAKGKEKKK